MNELALFAGAGGGILGGHLLGWRTRCAVEVDAYARGILLARQRDGLLPAFPVWDDVRTFDGRPWAGQIDVVSGGFPCQDVSAAGTGKGLDGERSGLWRDMARIIGEVRPRYVFVENSPLLVGRGLVRVLADLAEMGFDAQWGVVGADDCAAPHKRERLWIVADASCIGHWRQEKAVCPGRNTVEPCREVHDSDRSDRQEVRRSAPREGGHLGEPDSGARRLEANQHWPVEPRVGRVVDGVADRVDRLRCLGNGQVPRVAAAAWRILTHNASLSGSAASAASGRSAAGDSSTTGEPK